jgi:hypothetical protein
VSLPVKNREKKAAKVSSKSKIVEGQLRPVRDLLNEKNL